MQRESDEGKSDNRTPVSDAPSWWYIKAHRTHHRLCLISFRVRFNDEAARFFPL